MTRTGMVIPAPFGLSVMTDPPLKVPMIPQKAFSAHQAINNDRSLMANTTEVIINPELVWSLMNR